MAAVERLREEFGEVFIREEEGEERKLAQDDQRMDHQTIEISIQDMG